MNNKYPTSRLDNIVVQELKDETLICDLNSNQVYCLNQTAGEIWKLCNGKNSVKSISETLERKFNKEISEEIVLFSIEELSKNNLLDRKVSEVEIFRGLSRREVIRRIGLGSMIALPIITSITMPKAIQAQSSNNCTDNGDCFPDYCDLTTNTCQPRPNNCTNVPNQPNNCPPNLVCCGEGFQCSFGC